MVACFLCVGLVTEAQVLPPQQGHVLGVQLHLTGRDLNGMILNDDSLEGLRVEWVSLDEVETEEGVVEELILEETSFEGRTEQGRKVKKHDLEGALFDATLSDGSSLVLRIDEMQRGRDDLRNLYLYEVSYLGHDDTWRPLCGVDEEGDPVEALPLRGRWDYREGVDGGGDHLDEDGVFTFACMGYTLAKCVEGGYRPWQEVRLRGDHGSSTITLREHHQACTRLMRADYCGDGQSHTEDGLLISYHDGLGIRKPSEGWLMEGEWGPHGALCLVRLRLTEADVPCLDELLDVEDCGVQESLGEGTLLISELPPD